MNSHKVNQLNVQEPWFTQIKNGNKNVEGRLNKGKFKDLKVNDIILWNNEFKTKIIRITNYDSFYHYLINEGLRNTLPDKNINSIEAGINIYHKFYTPTMEKEYGVLAIELIHIK